jgi:hypothetical protein
MARESGWRFCSASAFCSNLPAAAGFHRFWAGRALARRLQGELYDLPVSERLDCSETRAGLLSEVLH